jgi:hypothetical protein
MEAQKLFLAMSPDIFAKVILPSLLSVFIKNQTTNNWKSLEKGLNSLINKKT